MLAVVTVNNLLDFVDGDTTSIFQLVANPGVDGISLREAIEAANATTGPDEIQFSPALVSGGSATIFLSAGELAISDSLTISGLGANLLTINASGSDPTPGVNNGDGNRAFLIGSGGPSIDVTISGITITGGETISPVDDLGAGILNFSILTLREVSIHGNRAQVGGDSGRGGGVANLQGVLTLDRCAIFDNDAAIGGGILNEGSMTIVNSTISGNRAAFAGGGIAHGFGAVNISHTTITLNRVDASGGGSGIISSDGMQVFSSIVAGNDANDDVRGGMTSLGFNLVGGGAGIGAFGPSEAGFITFSVAPLSLQGGPTPAHPLLPGSAALDAGDPAVVAGTGGVPLFDQRGAGFTRVRNGRIDIGAFEGGIANSDPVLSNPGDQFADEGTTFSFGGMFDFTDADGADTHTATVDWGDGSGLQTVTVIPESGGGTIAGSHVYNDDGVYTLTATVRDSQGGEVAESITVIVQNIAPTLTNVVVEDSSIREGQSATIRMTIADPGVLEVFSVEVDWRDGSLPDSIGGLGGGDSSGIVGGTSYTWVSQSRELTVSHRYLDDNPTFTPSDQYVVAISVRDDDGDSGLSSVNLTVANSRPTLVVAADQTVLTGRLLNLSAIGAPPLGLFNDLGVVDTHTATIDWGDGSPNESPVIFAAGGAGALGGMHTYQNAGSYTVAVTVTDDDGSSDTQSFSVMVENPVPQTFVVDTIEDVDDGDFSAGNFSFREAIRLANENPGTADTIEFAAALTANGAASILLTQGELSIADSLTINGPGASLLTIDASGSDSTPAIDDGLGSRIFNIDDNDAFTLQDVMIDGLTLTGGDSIAKGGAMRTLENLVLSASVLSGNSASDDGGAIYAASGILEIFGGRISNNNTQGFGGGAGINGVNATISIETSTISDNISGRSGGGIRMVNSELTVVDSTISGNRANNNDARFGGGIDNIDGNVTIRNSTISGNVASFGAGIWSRGSLSVFNSTIATNEANNNGSVGRIGGIYATGDTLVLENTIIAGNSDDGTAPDLRPVGPLATFSVRFSLVGIATGSGLAISQTPDANGNLIGSAASPILSALSPLADNGGPTLTHRLLPDSRAYNAGDPAASAGQNGVPQFDQRGSGVSRVRGGRLDMGAFEANSDPQAPNPGPRATIEGNVFSLNGLFPFTDADVTDTHTAVVVWGDGSPVESLVVTEANGNGSLSGSHVFADDGLYTVTVTVLDNQGGDDIESFLVTINNSAPTLFLAANQTATEGRILNLSAIGAPPLGVFIDKGKLDTHVVTVDWGDGSAIEVPAVFAANGSGALGATHIYAAAGVYTVTVKVDDDDQGTTTQSLLVTVEEPVPQTFVVDMLTDEDDGNYVAGDLSLREAIRLANENIGAADTIEFAPVLTAGGTATIVLTLGELKIADSVAIEGPGAEILVIDASGSDPTPNLNNGDGSRVFNVDDNSSADRIVLIDRLTLVGADAHGRSGGGAVFNAEQLTVSNATIRDNAASGPGVFFEDSGGAISTWDAKLTIVNSTITANSAGDRGGGVFSYASELTILNSTISANVAQTGGGIYAFRDAGPLSTTIEGTTISGNSATGSIGGGGILGSSGSLVIANSTISGNTTNGQGGGVFQSFGSVSIRHSTITANHGGSTYSYGGGLNLPSTIATIDNSIVAGNFATDLNTRSDLRAVEAQLTLRHSLIGDNHGLDPMPALFGGPDPNGNLIGDATSPIDPLLAALANNGGPTQTHRLLPGSPAINAGDPTATAGQNGIPSFDQRGDGFSRVRGGRLDLGALEVQNSRPDVVPPGTQSIDEGDSIDLTALVSFSDTDLIDQHTATVNWGEGSGEVPVTISEANGSGIVVGTHVYRDNGSYLVTIKVSDGQDFDVKEFLVNVANVSPTGVFGNSGPVLEGAAATVTLGSIIDPGELDQLAGLHFTFDFDNDGTFDVGDGTYAGSGTAASQSVPAQFLSNGPANRTVRARIIDKDGGSNDYLSDVVIENDQPRLIDVTGDTIAENQDAEVSATIVDVGPNDMFSVTVNWQDGTIDTVTGLGLADTNGIVGRTSFQWTAGSRSLVVRHLYIDDEPSGTSSDIYNVLLTVGDGVDSSAPITAAVRVNNALPFITTNNNTLEVDEGSIAVNSGTFGDVPEDLVTLSASSGTVVDNGNGTWNWSFAAADGPTETQQVTITATDDDGQSSSVSFELTVRNIAPIITVSNGSVNVNEGVAATNSGTFGDVPADTVTLAASIGSIVDNGNGTWSWSFAAIDGPDDAGQVTITVTDDDSQASSVSFQLTVSNVPPIISVTDSSVTVNEGATAANSGTFGDVSADTVELAASIGSIVKNDNGTWSWTFITADGPNDSRTVTITATDDDGQSSSVSFQLTVNNVAPAIAVNNNSVTVNEGATATNSGTFGDVSADRITLTASIGSIVDNGNGTWSWSLDTINGPEDSRIVSIMAIDDDGATSNVTFRLTVSNLPPLVGAVSYTPTESRPTTIQFRNGVLSGTYSDPGINDTHTILIDWGDRTPRASMSVKDGIFIIPHIYNSSGRFQLTFTVNDGIEPSIPGALTVDVVAAAKPTVDLNGPIAAGINSAVTATLGSTVRIGTLGTSTIFDVDSDFLKQVRVSVMKGGAAAAGLFQIDDQAGEIPPTILLSISEGVLILSAAPGLSGIAPAADFQNALQKIVFNGTSTGAGNASIFIVATDDTDLQGTAQVDVNLVTISNDVPPPEDPTEEIVAPSTFASPPVSLLLRRPSAPEFVVPTSDGGAGGKYLNEDDQPYEAPDDALDAERAMQAMLASPRALRREEIVDAVHALGDIELVSLLGIDLGDEPVFREKTKKAAPPVATPLAMLVEKPTLPPDTPDAPASHDNAAFWAAVAACGTLWVGGAWWWHRRRRHQNVNEIAAHL